MDRSVKVTSKHLQKKQRGVGLIEILVAVVLVSIGFLAAARMQVESMRFSQSAYFQSQAYFLASDMINRMRTNTEGVEAGDYDNVITSPGTTDQGCSAQACDASQIALQDLYDWSGYFFARNGNANFVPALPSSDSIQAFAQVVPVDDQIYQVSLTWSEAIRGEQVAQSLSVNFALAQEQ